MDSNNEFSEEENKSFVSEVKIVPHYCDYSFREDSIRQFHGKGSYPLQKYITDLQDMA